MANPEHLKILRQGFKLWNPWRGENATVTPDLSGADLSGTNLMCVNLIDANLRGANLVEANLRSARLLSADLSHAKLKSAQLRSANLIGANLCHADLRGAYLRDAKLGYSKLNSADLSYTDLFDADLSGADLNHANLSHANLRAVQGLNANFTGAVFTGVCIADWQISSSTRLHNISCDYIFRTYNRGTAQFSGRLPVDPNSTFAPGEFTQRFQILASAQETIDLTFTEGIDWQAFFRSFQELRSQHSDTNISIQGMERKAEGFIVRLEVNQEADKAIIETQAKQLYADQLQLLEAQYEERLRLQGAHLKDIRELLSSERQERTRLSKVVETMASEQKITQNFHSSVGNVAGTNYGSMTAYINQNSDDISRLLIALRETAQQFPEAQQDEALMELDDLEADLKAPEKQEPKRIGKRLQRLIAAGTAAATFAGGAATFSGNINEFTGNVLELAEKVGLSREVVQGE